MIGKQIKKFRRKKRITQEELEKVIGVTTQAVSNWERGGVPDAEQLSDIADSILYQKLKSHADLLSARLNG